MTPARHRSCQTADRSPLRAHADLESLRNMRTPRANLESLYGGGPLGSPYLYTRIDPPKLLEHDGDLPRNQEGLALVADPRHYAPGGKPFIPVEFADAAYRYGHSQIRQLYRLQPGGPLRPMFPDLIGFSEIGDRRVDWSLLFDVPGYAPAQRSKPIDGQLPRSLIELPEAITGAVAEESYHSLAARDLQRGAGTGLPSGESVARSVGAPVLTAEELDLRRHGWHGETPLWLYILRESAARTGGERLGPVGALIVGEVPVAIIAADPESYLAVDPDWTPTLPAREVGFRLRDLLMPAP